VFDYEVRIHVLTPDSDSAEFVLRPRVQLNCWMAEATDPLRSGLLSFRVSWPPEKTGF
jgi:hypothetical protein